MCVVVVVVVVNLSISGGPPPPKRLLAKFGGLIDGILVSEGGLCRLRVVRGVNFLPALRMVRRMSSTAKEVGRAVKATAWAGRESKSVVAVKR